jgi:N6-adenosine-specific RNA methylase IME4
VSNYGVDAMFSSLPLRGSLSKVGWEIPADMTVEEWGKAGRLLYPIRHGLDWWLGDWWSFSEKRYGHRTAIARTEGWHAKTCANHASVSRAFSQTSRRRELLDWTHHAMVASLSPDVADDLLDWCLIGGRPKSTRELKGELRRRKIPVGSPGEACTIESLNTPIMQGKKFGTIYADPPWMYEDDRLQPPGYHFRGMTIPEISNLPVRELAADDAHLHLWTVDAVLEESFKVFRAWGFDLQCSFVWTEDQLGTGNLWRKSHDIVLTGRRGNAKRFNDKGLRSWINTDRLAHSEKPEEVRKLIQRGWVTRAAPRTVRKKAGY